MDSKYTTDIFQHLEKQNEYLIDVYRAMFHELHKLQVEEEMLTRKLFEVMVKKQWNKVETTQSPPNTSNPNEPSESL